MVGKVLQKFLPDPCFAKTDRIRHHHPVVARQNLPSLSDRIFLELGQVHSRPADTLGRTIQIVLEVFEQCLHVNLIRRVLELAELRCVQKSDKIVLEISCILPLPFIPLLQLYDGSSTDLALDKLAVL